MKIRPKPTAFYTCAHCGVGIRASADDPVAVIGGKAYHAQKCLAEAWKQEDAKQRGRTA